MRRKRLFFMTSACTFHEFHQCCGSGMFIPDPASKFFHPRFWIQSQKDSESWIRIRIKEFKYFFFHCGRMPLFFVYFSYFITYIHSITFIQYIYLSPFAEVSLHLLMACKLSGKNLPLVMSWESNLGLPYSKPTRYQLNHTASYRAMPHRNHNRAALHRNWAALHRNWAALHRNWAALHRNWAALHRNWATPHCTEPHPTVLSHASPYWATLHHTEPRRTVLSHAAPYWAMPHCAEPRRTVLRNTPHRTDPRRTVLNQAAPYWATQHCTEPRRTVSEQRHTVLSHTAPLSMLNPKNCFQALGNMIRDVLPWSRFESVSWFFSHPGPRSWFFIHPRSQIQRWEPQSIKVNSLAYRFSTDF